MKFEEYQKAWLEAVLSEFIQRRKASDEIRGDGELSFRIEDQSVILFEKLKRWDNPSETFDSMIAKATFVKASADWKVYWQKSDMKWHRYDSETTVGHFDKFLKIVGLNGFGCFWG